MTTAHIDSLVRPNVRRLEPYRSARGDYGSGVLLDANENPFRPSVPSGDIPLNRYPDPLQKKLRHRLAELNDVDDEMVFVGSGSDEVIDLLIRVFCEPRIDAIVAAEPTYGMYGVAAATNDTEVRSIMLADEFQLDVDALLAARSDDAPAKLFFCCSPNNPTGNLLRHHDIVRLCQESGGIIVVDEAYIEFSPEGSVVPLVRLFPNLVVMRTLSKAWGLAGLRVGYAIADPAIVGYIIKIKPPYNVGSLTAATALQGISDPEAMRRSVELIVAERHRMAAALTALPSVDHIYPSDANFLLIRCHGATELHKALAGVGVIVRDRSSQPGLAGSLRLTIGTPDENDRFLEAFTSLSHSLFPA